MPSNFSEPLWSSGPGNWLSPDCPPDPFIPRSYHLGLTVCLSVSPHPPPGDCDLLKELESCSFSSPIPYGSTHVGGRKKEGRGGGGGPRMSCRHCIRTYSFHTGHLGLSPSQAPTRHSGLSPGCSVSHTHLCKPYTCSLSLYIFHGPSSPLPWPGPT